MLPLLWTLAFAAPETTWIVTTAGPPPAAPPRCTVAPLAPSRAVYRMACDAGFDPSGPLGRQAGVRRVTRDVDLGLTWADEPDDLDRAWWLRNSGQVVGGRAGTSGADVGAVMAWALAPDAKAAPIAVLDSGTRLEHEDLADNLWVNQAEADGEPGVDDDGNGWIDDVHGWGPDGAHDPATGCNNAHGTVVAGVAGAVGDNGVGYLGMAPRSSLMPIRIIGADCRATAAGLIGALDYARVHGAKVLNFSATYTVSVDELEEAWRALADEGVVLVLAAGNDGRLKTLDSATFPLRHGLSTAIGVAATDNRDGVASFSAVGPEVVHVAAPGVGVAGPLSSSTSAYAPSVSGTSVSAPIVAGAAALIRARWPTLPTEDVLAALRDGTSPLAALDCDLTERCVAWGGRLDAGQALAIAEVRHGGPRLDVRLDDRIDPAAPGDLLPLLLTIRNDGHDPAVGLTAVGPAPSDVVPALPDPLAVAGTYEGELWVEVPWTCDEDYVWTVEAWIAAEDHEPVRAEAAVFVRCPEDDTDDPDTDDPDTGDTDDPDTGDPDTGDPDIGDPDPFDPPDPPPSGTGCACDGGAGGGAPIALGVLALLLGRRRRSAARR